MLNSNYQQDSKIKRKKKEIGQKIIYLNFLSFI